MARLKPWYQVIVPREDLREGKPLDAAEFAVHLHPGRDGRTRKDYQHPARFFSRTFLTQNLLNVSAGAVRCLAGETTESSAACNMATPPAAGQVRGPAPTMNAGVVVDCDVAHLPAHALPGMNGGGQP